MRLLSGPLITLALLAIPGGETVVSASHPMSIQHLYRDLEAGGDQRIIYSVCGNPLPAFWTTGVENWDSPTPRWNFDTVLCGFGNTNLQWESANYFCAGPSTSACWVIPAVWIAHGNHRDFVSTDILFDRVIYPILTNPAAVSVVAHEWGHNMSLTNHDTEHQCVINSVMGKHEGGNPCILQAPSGPDLHSVQCIVYRHCFQTFVLETGTPLEQTGANWSFDAADYNGEGTPDTFNIKRYNTGSGNTEVHILSGSSNFQAPWLLQTATPLGPTVPNHYSFVVADWNGGGKPDLIAIQMQATFSNRTEVHILSGESNYQQWLLLMKPTALGPTDSTNWAFSVGDWNLDGKPDIWAIQKQRTGTGTTEVHILSGASDFTTYLLNTGTNLPLTSTNHVFEVGNYNVAGKPDLFDIQMSLTGSGKTEVHILDGLNLSGPVGTRLLDIATPYGPTDSTNWAFPVADWTRDTVPDLIVLQRQGTATNSTEVHVLGG
jgi:hypothetical protein